MSKIEVNTVAPQCGTTLTLGESGDTVTLGAGASQSGFGRTGTVDWDTTPKTATFTAASGEGYFCNTSGGAFEVDLPAGVAGAIVSVQDYNNTFDTNNLTIDPNGSEKINGGDAGLALTLSTEGQGLTLVYIDATVGWRSVHSDDFSQVPLTPAFITATGGTVLTVGDFKTHVFTGPGTFCVSCAGNPFGSSTVDYFVVAGGGGSASNAGGGGAGGFRVSNSVGCVSAPTMSPLASPTSLPVSVTGYSIAVGSGGAPAGSGCGATANTPGGVSSFSTITSTGGGRSKNASNPEGGPGGSGGGTYNGTTGAGNTPVVSPPQGNDGGAAAPGPSYIWTSGGGAGAAGSNANPPIGGAGSYIGDTFLGPTAPSYGTPGPVSSTRYFAGGGGGANQGPTSSSNHAGGVGGGGTGAAVDTTNNTAGTTNTGGGGGGGTLVDCTTGGNGGSGIVLIRYKFQN